MKRTIDQHRQWMKKIPGLMGLMNFLYRLFKPQGQILVEVQKVPMYVNCQDDIVTPEILAYGYHEELETKLVQKILKPGMTVVDLGANMGYYSLVAAQCVGTRGKVYSFEPDVTNYKIFIKNIEVNKFDHIVPVQAAVSNEVGTSLLYQDEVNFGAHTLCKGNIQVSTKESREVKTIRLDDYLRDQSVSQIDFLKMDIQGAEGQVLETMIELMKLPKLKMLIEYWPEGLERMDTNPMHMLKKFKDFNYSISTFINGKLQKMKSLDETHQLAVTNSYLNLFLEKDNFE